MGSSNGPIVLWVRPFDQRLGVEMPLGLPDGRIIPSVKVYANSAPTDEESCFVHVS